MISWKSFFDGIDDLVTGYKRTYDCEDVTLSVNTTDGLSFNVVEIADLGEGHVAFAHFDPEKARLPQQGEQREGCLAGDCASVRRHSFGRTLSGRGKS